MPPSITLGPRLQSIFELVESAQQRNRYDCIWDCCCDHGYLGMKMLSEPLCEKLYFVDQVPHITQQLEAKLTSFPAPTYEVVTGDAARLRFNPNQQHLVMLTGVGGEHIINIIHAIGQSHPDGQIDFVFCPTTTQYNLREYLVAQDFALAHESITTEKNREYEVIYVRGKAAGTSKPRVSLTGNMWDGENSDHRRYLAKLMTHYQKRTRGDEAERSKKIFQVYQDCLNIISAS